MRNHILKAALSAALFFGAAGSHLLAQETAQDQAGRETLEQRGEFKWKTINTAIFAALLGYLIAKAAPAFFNARSADIERAIKESTGLKLDADLRYSEADRKMATLGEEVKRIRAEAAAEMEREHQRIRDETAQERAHIQRNVTNEIEGLRLEGMQQVRRRTASAALDLAEQQLRDRGPGQDDNLLHDFVQIVGGSK